VKNGLVPRAARRFLSLPGFAAVCDSVTGKGHTSHALFFLFPTAIRTEVDRGTIIAVERILYSLIFELKDLLGFSVLCSTA